MKEVGARVFHIFFKPLARKGVPLDDMIADTSIDVDTLRSKSGRLDWADLCTIHRNLRPHFSSDDLVELGRTVFRQRAIRFMFLIGRILLTPMGFYRWLNTPRKGAGNQLFTCVRPSHREIDDNRCEIELTLPDGYEVCWDFFLITQGSFEQLPRLLGYGAAEVMLERIDRGGRFHITVPNRTTLITRIRRGLTWPFTVRAVARELQETNETLVERYEELEEARGKIERQRGQLDSAYRIGQQVFGERDLAAIGTAVTNSLLELPTIEGAWLVIDEPSRAGAGASGEGSELGGGAGAMLITTAGAIGDDQAAAVVELPGQPSRGSLKVWPDGEDARSLLALLAPTLALAIDNAVAYRELDEYRRGLELVVERRTAELRRASAQLAATVDQLRDAQSAREKFFGNISHEIRTPLSLILLATADVGARGGMLLDARGRADLGTINDSARKLLRLVDELLLLAASDARALTMSPEPTDIARAVATLGDTWRPAAEAAGLELEVRTPARSVVSVDPVAFERMVTNLVSNAVKYTPRGGRVELLLDDTRDDRVSAAPRSEHVVIEVRDTGTGIDDELRPRLFDRFARVHGAASAAGSGIGLSLVKQLAEAHGGTIGVQPNPGGGSVFRLELPCNASGEDLSSPRDTALQLRPVDFGIATALAHADAPAHPAEPAGSVLVVDDDPRLALMIARVLSDDYAVWVANDGASALELARQHQPHVLVADVDMPAMDGIELARRFRDVTGDRLAPIVILSALSDLSTRLAGLSAGAIDYVVKPFDPRELLARVRAQFRMRDLAIRLHRAEQLSALGTLAAGLAHELRNPANGIVNAMQPLRELLPPGALTPGTPAAELFDVVVGCATQVAFLSRQLLGFRHREGTIEKRVVELPDLVRRAVFLAQDALRGVDVRVQVAPVAIRCAPPLLVQVLTNLFENAGHAAGGGGWIAIDARRHNGAIVVEITDSGPGVPVELRDRVFEPFFTTKAPGMGTGLGLPLARDIVHRHGGVLEIRERSDCAMFVVELPQPVSEA